MIKIPDYIKNEVYEIRKDLHKIPEISFEEINTCRYIIEKLKSYGYGVESVAGTGVVASRRINESQGAIAFRADMDALEVKEETGVEFKSLEDGKMHACGHDGHMAILLGLAKYISTLEDIKRDIVFIFQPAEEKIGGAKEIISEGVLVRYNIEEIFGLHIMPEIEEGKVGIKSGPLMAKVANLDIVVRGKSGHGAMPQTTIDSIYIASQLINSYQGIISRAIEPVEGAIITIGEIHGGEARNVIAGEVKMRGTVRAFDQEVYDKITQRVEEINEAYEKIHGAEIDTIFEEMYPSVVNDNDLFESMKEILSEDETLIMKPMMISEDFSYYQREAQGFFFMLGSRNKEKGYEYPLHNCKFNFSEEVMINGLEIYLRICKKFGII